MKSNYRLLLSGLIPILGLISCSQDKQTHVSDSWGLKPPVARASKNGEVREYKLTEPSGPIEANAEVVFSDSDDLKNISLVIKSTCRKATDSFSEDFELNGLSKFPLISIVPKKLWMDIDKVGIEGVTCGFEVTAKNSIGSTHTISISTIQLTQNQSLEKQLLKKTSIETANPESKTEINLETEKIEAYRFADSAAKSADAKTEYRLNCERFTNVRVLKPNSRRDSVLNDLINGKIESVDTNSPDPRHAFTKQKCRVVVIDSDEKSGLSTPTFSPQFEMQYPKLTTVKFDFGFDAGQIQLSDKDWFRIARFPYIMAATFQNNSTAVKAFRISKADGQTVAMHIVMLNENHVGEAGNAPASKLKTTFQNVARVHDEGADYLIEVAPKSEGKVIVSMVDNVECAYFSAGGPWNIPLGLPDYAGMAYAISALPSSTEYLNWDSVIMSGDFPKSLEGWKPAATAKNIAADFPPGRGAVLPYWSPSAVWTQQSGSSNSPITHFDTTVTKRAYCGTAPASVSLSL